MKELEKETKQFDQDIDRFRQSAQRASKQWEAAPDTNAALVKLTQTFEPLAETSRDLIKQTDMLFKLASQLLEAIQKAPSPQSGDHPSPTGRGAGGEGAPISMNGIRKQIKVLDEARAEAVQQLKLVRYFWKQAHWLTERFPEAKLRNVEGLVKLVDLKEIEANDWSLTPGRYVGVAPEEVDEDFDFEETLREIHVELEDLNAEAVTLAATIKRNFEELGV